jgi:hypothetical protein
MSRSQFFKIPILTSQGLSTFAKALACVLLATACSSTPEEIERVNPAEIMADRMFYIQAPMPQRGESQEKPKPFFFKDCSLNRDNSHYSKTAYFCDQR